VVFVHFITSGEIERIHKEVLKFERIEPSPIRCTKTYGRGRSHEAEAAFIQRTKYRRGRSRRRSPLSNH
jgi:hypothetical protein